MGLSSFSEPISTFCLKPLTLLSLGFYGSTSTLASAYPLVFPFPHPLPSAVAYRSSGATYSAILISETSAWQGLRLALVCCSPASEVISYSSSPQPQPQPQSTDEMFAADHHMSFSFPRPVKEVSTSVGGFVCVSFSGYQSGRKFMAAESVVCNPSTGQSLIIPRMKTMKRTGMIRFFGYDLVEKQHKVLAMVRPPGRGNRTEDHQVLTLLGGGNERATWRMAECGIPCASSRDRQNICINGVFYYIELVSDGGRDGMIICFDLTSEKFSSVEFDRDLNPVRRNYPGWLLDFNGKLALIPSGSLYVTSKSIVMWVLQDSEWSKLVYILPPVWKVVVGPEECLEIIGVTGPNEFVMSPRYSSDPFHVYYCDFEKETVTRVVIQGMGAFGSGRRYSVRTCLNHVEDLKRMEL
ncbi:unnamed protein product [Brassica napus]|uniref:(rape) hypothetical protein n=2 Tax=Brassica napus TaxID=3708 RepID=A0A816JKH8_BRANA|nr:unnamed protein product [Brassica napus]